MFGTVSGAIMTVMAQRDSEMCLRTIHAEVERVLGGPVSLQSVADYLGVRSRGKKPLFVRTRYGHYKLAEEMGARGRRQARRGRRPRPNAG